MFAMDAIFGLPRKKAACSSFRSPLYDNIFFCNDQQDLDQFVNESSNKKSSNIKQVSLKYFLLYLYGNVYGYCYRIVMTL